MNSQGQFSDSESNQNPLISTAFNPQDTPVSFHERQESSIAPSETNMTQPPDSQPQPTVTNAYLQPDSSANLRTRPVHPTDFFFRPPNDYYHYHVICKEISNDNVAYLLNKSLKERNAQSNEGIFYYQQQYNNQLYQVSYEIVSPLLVNNCLSKNFLGIEFQQNMEQEHLVLTFDQREYLECHLKKYLSQYLLG
ncbi:uncharacterized protein OCT59_000952 [Rhizophagus irregularis]|uniref:Uncharacterized protein n=2 Tax=Rhizophagus irregularis TaxID=588596 RepID=A0A015KXB4_RHIIW|nr:hypothetical protein GLOIN_2v1472113 [Rhizophagus irregularis DAOM 181602=DAOM 197198]EXX72214.1 hypothetical protein RirG_071390 [Rhizophagus irregularis DAOM 197198w]UZN99685.1 hypothetical protein OCT59_000952 [Rhizophagus irregularis]POG79893.1 hypothetical protein GLOIN_2v1472113 [Rhizophagus irregularis DAOM 181602=DAOM 197198]CAG8603634.1 20160_t:CDS:1 [Rhizophagus irregularis]GBC28577.1 hypothetical protein GLOIN_2v1472113 [Rhizophagus irregularis DAOM 181602=DAOM 197198]|eukprot:XP_025186759.1 hypothetical protein GLOIN_2v1472113 [Rhizophagus irregularis DAOM 181602=DAOM 197198]